jgi:hypothetical protein
MITEYHPVSFFSLRPSETTASGGQTLLVPTAFALKMALLRVSIQTAGIAEGKRRFPAIRDLRFALCAPDHITVLKTFNKILRPFEAKDPKTKEEEIARHRDHKQYPFQTTIAYREYVQFGDPLQPPAAQVLRVACIAPDGAMPEWLAEALLGINYVGKRGGLLQALKQPAVFAELDPAFFEISRDSVRFLMGGTLQMLDDWSPSMRYEHADVYDPKPIRLGKERVLRQVVLPYRLTRSNREYSVYERIFEAEASLDG